MLAYMMFGCSGIGLFSFMYSPCKINVFLMLIETLWSLFM